MAGILDYSTTPGSNTSINGIGIQGTNSVLNFDNALRQYMADIASEITREVVKVAGSYTAVKADYRQLWRATGAATFNLTAAATLTSGWSMLFMADGGAITVDPNAAELINGASTLTIADGTSALVLCTGTAFRAIVIGNGTVTLAGTQTLTNKTLTSPTITTPAITGPAVVSNTSAGTALTLRSTDGGGSGGPDLVLDRFSASPAVNDLLSFIIFQGRDSAANTQVYGQVYAQITDPVSGSEDGVMVFETPVAGTVAGRLSIGAGVYTPTATGGDKGAGTVNATAFYMNGSSLSGAPDAVLEDQKTAGTNGGAATSGAWRTRTLNTATNSTLLPLTGSDQFTPAVAGYVEWSAPAYACGTNKTRLYNVTDSTVAGFGSSASASSSNFAQSLSVGGCAVVAGKAYRLEHQVTTTNGTNGFGDSGAGFSQIEIYSRVRFWRTAP